MTAFEQRKITKLEAENAKLKLRNERLMAGNCVGCGKSVDHHYCGHCRKLWES